MPAIMVNNRLVMTSGMTLSTYAMSAIESRLFCARRGDSEARRGEERRRRRGRERQGVEVNNSTSSGEVEVGVYKPSTPLLQRTHDSKNQSPNVSVESATDPAAAQSLWYKSALSTYAGGTPPRPCPSTSP